MSEENKQEVNIESTESLKQESTESGYSDEVLKKAEEVNSEVLKLKEEFEILRSLVFELQDRIKEDFGDPDTLRVKVSDWLSVGTIARLLNMTYYRCRRKLWKFERNIRIKKQGKTLYYYKPDLLKVIDFKTGTFRDVVEDVFKE